MIHPSPLKAIGALILSLFGLFIYLDLNHMNATRLEQRIEERLIHPPPPSQLHLSSPHKLVQLKALPPSIMNNISTTDSQDDQISFEFDQPEMKDNPNLHLPPLSTLLDSYGNVTGDVQSLLQFAIIGFGKCGRSDLDGEMVTNAFPFFCVYMSVKLMAAGERVSSKIPFSTSECV
jgi:hypothetical protein